MKKSPKNQPMGPKERRAAFKKIAKIMNKYRKKSLWAAG